MPARKKPAKSAKPAAAPLLYDVDYIRSVASPQWPSILAALTSIPIESLDGNHHPCPWCGGTDRFRFTNLNGQGACICNQCFRTGNGDGFAAIQRDRGCNFIEAVKLVADYLGIPPTVQGGMSKARAAAAGGPGARRPGGPGGFNGHRNGGSNGSGSGNGSGKTPPDPAADLEFIAWDEPFTGNDMRARVWCTWKEPVAFEAILAVGGRIAKYQKRHDVIAIPIWGEQLDAAPPVGWCLYELGGGYLPRKQKNKETGKWEVVEQLKVKLTTGSKPGLIADLARLRAARVVVKVEGPSDCLAALSLADLPADHAVVTNANGANERPHAWMIETIAHGHGEHGDSLTTREAMVIHDADLPGQQGAIGSIDEKTAKFRPGWANYLAAAIPTRNIALPFPVAESHGQDLRDYLNLDPPPGFAGLQSLIDASPFIDSDPTLAAPATNPAEQEQISHDDDSPLEPADDPSTATPATVIEEEDDPHYLARVNIARYSALSGGGCIRYWREQFYTWKPCRACYKSISPPEFFSKVMATVKHEFNRQWEELYAQYRAWCSSDSYDESADKGPPKARKVTIHLVKNVVAALSSICLIPSSVDLTSWVQDEIPSVPATPTTPAQPATTAIRERRPYVAMLNGIININALLDDAEEADCILPHSPCWFSTVRLPYEFKLGAECPKWLSFLNYSLENDQRRIDILQEWAGYCLTFDTSYQKFLAMEGEGGNGKSVFMAGLQAMLGAENCQHIGLERLVGGDYDAGETFGKLVNFCADVGEIDKLAEGNLKSFTSGDVMSFKRKFLSNLTAKPTARLILSFNNRPRFSDRSQGVWRRMLLIPWRIQIPATRRVLGMDSADWWEQSGELPGIFNWALQGLWRLRMQKQFTASELVTDAIQDYQDESNPVRTYLRENFEPGRGIVKSKDAYRFYVDWALETGHKPMNERTFGKEFQRMFPGSPRKYGGSRSSRYYYYDEIHFSQDEICGKPTPKNNLLEEGFDE